MPSTRYPSGSGSGGNAAYGNFTTANTPNIAAIFARAQSGLPAATQGRGKVFALGDSRTAGYTGGGTDDLTNARAYAFPAQLASLLTASGYAARADYACGDGGQYNVTHSGAIANVTTYDPRIVFSGSPVLYTGADTFGGTLWQLNPGDSFTFSPGRNCNTVKILSVYETHGGPLSVSFDGGTTTAGTINNNTDNNYHLDTVTVPSGGKAGTVKVTAGGTGSSYVSAVGMIDTTAPGIEIINAGISSAALATLAASASSGGRNLWPMLAAIVAQIEAGVPNWFTINGWFNDIGAGWTLSQIIAFLTTIITTLKQYGDVVYLGYPPFQITQLPKAAFDQYQDAMIATAQSLGAATIDPRKMTPTWEIGQPLGLYGDWAHWNAAGYGLDAVALAGIRNII